MLWHRNGLLKKSQQILFCRNNVKYQIGEENIFLQTVECILVLSKTSNGNSIAKNQLTKLSSTNQNRIFYNHSQKLCLFKMSIKNIIQVQAIANHKLDCIQYSLIHTEDEPCLVKGCKISFLTTCFSQALQSRSGSKPHLLSRLGAHLLLAFAETGARKSQ